LDRALLVRTEAAAAAAAACCCAMVGATAVSVGAVVSVRATVVTFGVDCDGSGGALEEVTALAVTADVVVGAAVDWAAVVGAVTVGALGRPALDFFTPPPTTIVLRKKK
jgi:hypothetical protein